MDKILITLKGENTLGLFIELVESLKAPNVKTSVIIEGSKSVAFLISPERSIEIKTL